MREQTAIERASKVITTSNKLFPRGRFNIDSVNDFTCRVIMDSGVFSFVETKRRKHGNRLSYQRRDEADRQIERSRYSLAAEKASYRLCHGALRAFFEE